MARIYANKCEREKSFLFVQNNPKLPDTFKAEVRAIIEADGYVITESGEVVESDGGGDN